MKKIALLLTILLMTLSACATTYTLEETKELPDEALTWSTLKISPRGIKTNLKTRAAAADQSFDISMPEIHIRAGVQGAYTSFYSKFVISVAARKGLDVTGTVKFSVVDPRLPNEPIGRNTNPPTFHEYEGRINTSGAKVQTFQVRSSIRPCLRIKFRIESSSGGIFSRSSNDLICPAEPPKDLKVKFLNQKKIYASPDQLVSVELSRPFMKTNPMRGETFTITAPGVTNLRLQSYFSYNRCENPTPDTLKCEGIYAPYNPWGSVVDYEKTKISFLFDVPNNLNQIPLSITYSDQGTDSNTQNNTASLLVNVLPATDVNLMPEWEYPTQAYIGAAIPYTLRVRNIGTTPSSATRVRARIGYVQPSSIPSNCGMEQNYWYSCVLPPIEAGESGTLTWVISTNSNQFQMQSITYVTGQYRYNQTADKNVFLENDPATITDLEVAVTVTPDPPTQNAGTVFTVTVSNVSDVQSVNSRMSWIRTGVNQTVTGCNADPLDPQNPTYLCELGTIAPHTQKIVTFTNLEAETVPSATYSFQVFSDSLDLNYQNDYFTFPNIEFPSADFSISLIPNPEPPAAAPGQTYQVTIKNEGVETGHGDIYLSYTGIAELQFNTERCNSSVYYGTTYIYCTTPTDLEPNQAFTETFTTTTEETASQIYLNAQVNGSNENNTSNNQTNLDYWLSNNPNFTDYAITVTPSPTPPTGAAGQVYQVTIKNKGSQPMAATWSFSYSSFNAANVDALTYPNTCTIQYTGASTIGIERSFSCPLEPLNGGQSVTFEIVQPMAETSPRVGVGVYITAAEANYSNNSSSVVWYQGGQP
jgi:hypothetical protein